MPLGMGESIKPFSQDESYSRHAEGFQHGPLREILIPRGTLKENTHLPERPLQKPHFQIQTQVVPPVVKVSLQQATPVGSLTESTACKSHA